MQGSDHHSTVTRVRAGLQALGLGIPAGYPDYVLHKMVTVMKGGEEVKISKRAGSYVTVRDLIDGVGRDAVRFFLVSRKADTEFTFDIDLARSQSEENPVYYVQYAHARVCVGAAAGRDPVRRPPPTTFAAADLSPLTRPYEDALMRRLADFPDELAAAARELAPHQVAVYLKELAGDFHSYYNAERFLVDEPPCSARASRSRRRPDRCCATAWRCSASPRRSRCDARRRPRPTMTTRSPSSRPVAANARPRAPRKAAFGGTLIGLFVGVIVGLAIAAGAAYYLMRSGNPYQASTAKETPREGVREPAKPGKADAAAPEKPRFDFYKILPGAEEAKVQPKAAEKSADRATWSGRRTRPARPPAATRRRRSRTHGRPGRRARDGEAAEPVPPAAKAGERFWLQAGSFAGESDAENLKARLALAGWEAAVQKAEIPDKGTRYRVRLGPYDNTDELIAHQRRARQARLRRRGDPPVSAARRAGGNSGRPHRTNERY